MKKLFVIGGITLGAGAILYWLSKKSSTTIPSITPGKDTGTGANPYSENWACTNIWSCYSSYAYYLILTNPTYLAQLKQAVTAGKKVDQAMIDMYYAGGAWSPWTASKADLDAFKAKIDEIGKGYSEDMVKSINDGKGTNTWQTAAINAATWILIDNAKKAAGLSGLGSVKIKPDWPWWLPPPKPPSWFIK